MRFRMLAAVTPLLLSLAVAAPCAAQESAAPDTAAATTGARSRSRIEPQPRTGWMFGIGGGYAIGGPRTDLDQPDQESGSTIHFRFGAGLGGSAMVGLEYLTFGANPTDSTSYDVVAAGPSFTWYWPSNLYVRGMVGWASLKADFETGTPPTTTPVKFSDDGFCFLLGAGWEWRFRTRLGIAPQVEYLHLTAGNETTASVAAGSLQFNWYY